MVRIAFLTVVVAMLVATCGCNAVMMSPEYSDLLDRTTALSKETATRAKAGELTDTQMVDALDKQADVWQRFKDAKDGVK